MSLKKIDTITLYTYEDENVDQGYHLRTFLANNNIEFQHLHYNTDANKKDILAPLNTWIDPNDDEIKSEELAMIREFLRPYWEKTKELWEPFSNEKSDC